VLLIATYNVRKGKRNLKVEERFLHSNFRNSNLPRRITHSLLNLLFSHHGMDLSINYRCTFCRLCKIFTASNWKLYLLVLMQITDSTTLLCFFDRFLSIHTRFIYEKLVYSSILSANTNPIWNDCVYCDRTRLAGCQVPYSAIVGTTTDIFPQRCENLIRDCCKHIQCSVWYICHTTSGNSFSLISNNYETLLNISI
jgi:hypothetical protein